MSLGGLGTTAYKNFGIKLCYDSKSGLMSKYDEILMQSSLFRTCTIINSLSNCDICVFHCCIFIVSLAQSTKLTYSEQPEYSSYICLNPVVKWCKCKSIIAY